MEVGGNPTIYHSNLLSTKFSGQELNAHSCVLNKSLPQISHSTLSSAIVSGYSFNGKLRLNIASKLESKFCFADGLPILVAMASPVMSFLLIMSFYVLRYGYQIIIAKTGRKQSLD